MPSLRNMLLALGATIPSIFAGEHHPLLGPVFSVPRGLSTNPRIRAAAASLSTLLERSLQHGTTQYGNFTPNATSLSISMASASEEAALLDFHFTSAHMKSTAGGASQVTSESIYRIGSVSKLFTVYTLLLNDGRAHWDCPVTDFIPELRVTETAIQDNRTSEVDSVRWEHVTIGSLASQLAGIGCDYNAGDLACAGFPWVQYGLPELDSEEMPTCGCSKPCPRDVFFRGFTKRHPVFAPQSTPIYSNAAFQILAYVVEAITGDTYQAALNKAVLRPLGLGGTSLSKPYNNSCGVIPEGDSSWDDDLGDLGPTGGMYSSTADLSKLCRAILSSAQLSPLETRRWMKPVTHTSSLTFSVGAPWEIWRTRSQTSHGYVIDLYTKSGSVPMYHSLVILIPDFQIAFTILTAGPDSAVINIAAEMAVQAFLPLLDEISREAEKLNFGGQYWSEEDNVNSSLSLTIDQGPGLVIDRWISHGSDLLATTQAYSDATGGGKLQSVRLYPTNLRSVASSSGSARRVAYRAVFEMKSESGLKNTTRVFDTDSASWSSVDRPMYGNVAVDDFVFDLDADGAVTGVEIRVLRTTLRKGNVIERNCPRTVCGIPL